MAEKLTIIKGIDLSKLFQEPKKNSGNKNKNSKKTKK